MAHAIPTIHSGRPTEPPRSRGGLCDQGPVGWDLVPGASPAVSERGVGLDGGPAGAARKLGVLVVDDDDLVRQMLQVNLQRQGFAVWLAANGTEAIDLYRRVRDDVVVVLLDVRMPGPDGLQTLQVLRGLDPDVRCCLMSGYADEFRLDDLLKTGARHFIPKPFRLPELTRVIRSLAGVPEPRSSS